MARRENNFSDLVTKTLTSIGYSWDSVLQRRDCFKRLEQIQTNVHQSNSGLALIVAGSKREGATKILQVGGDMDLMCVLDEVICTEDTRQHYNRTNLTLFEIDTRECTPGYTFLQLKQHGGRVYMHLLGNELARVIFQKIVNDSCCLPEPGHLYISSEAFINIYTTLMQTGICVNGILKSHIFADNISVQQRAGPSIPATCSASKHELATDNVLAFPCDCPSLFEKFRNRPRKHGWPSLGVLQELSLLEAHVVPVGDKTSATHYMQWRICFTKAEIRLIECLTEPQFHVFVLLKILAKEVLKPVWDKITSYVVKNVVLWMSELTPIHKFQNNKVVDRVLDCLVFIKACIKGRFLPNYMIFERNLLMHDSFIVKRKRLISLLDACLYEKGSCLLRSPTLKEALLDMYSHPETVAQEGLNRAETERVYLTVMVRMMPGIHNGFKVQDALHMVLSGEAAPLFRHFMHMFAAAAAAADWDNDVLGCVRKVIDTMISSLR